MLLEVKNLKVESNGEKILKGVDFKINLGETQALLGPNASGKSTLAQVILGNPKYKISQGQILFRGKNITRLPPEKRVKLGMALSWQNPPAIKGVKFFQLLDKISRRRIENEKLGINQDLLKRELNLDLSGGEKKLSELLQVLSLNPKLVILDEIDSGLDLRRLEKVARVIKKELINKKISVLLITHSGEILRFLKPKVTNVMINGRIICRQEDFRKVLRTIKKYGYEKCKERALFSN
jgi:Fe-S cluster assembly ATP-binding protein